jgi:hypothetical protein
MLVGFIPTGQAQNIRWFSSTNSHLQTINPECLSESVLDNVLAGCEAFALTSWVALGLGFQVTVLPIHVFSSFGKLKGTLPDPDAIFLINHFCVGDERWGAGSMHVIEIDFSLQL